MAILLVYFISTIHSLRNELAQKELLDTQARESMMVRAREERMLDMEYFFETHEVSCTCNQ